MTEVIQFIKKFNFRKENNVKDCFHSYWFATILFIKFIRYGAEIVVDYKRKIFGVRIRNVVYDMSGEVKGNYNWVLWDSLDENIKKTIEKEL